MQLEREHTKKGVKATVITYPNVGEDELIEADCKGVIKIEQAAGLELPGWVEIDIPEDSYVEIFGDKKVHTDNLPVTFNCGIYPIDKNENNFSATIKIHGENESKEIKLPLRPAHIINSSGKIVENSLDEGLWNDILPYNRRRDLSSGPYRKNIRKHVGFKNYYRILNSIYEYEDIKRNKTEDIINSFEKHVVSEGAKYHPTTNEQFKQMLDFYSGLEKLPSFDEKQIDEFKGYINENFAKQAVWSGDFNSAKDYLSRSISHFEDADRPEIKKPTVIKIEAITGLISETNGEFKKAQNHYEEAATDFDYEDGEIYAVWAQLAEVKHHLANRDYKTAISTYKSISGGDLKYSLVDLTKLKVLVDLLEDLENDEISDGSTVFSNAKMPGTPEKLSHENNVTRDLIVQYDTDYSSAYSVLLSKQQLKKLERDSIDAESLQSAIVDGITPKGNESSPSKIKNDGSDDEMGATKQEESSGLDKIKERSRDRTYDALEDDNDETISYESHIEEIQQGSYNHEQALDTLEDYLSKFGLRGGKTKNSDLIVADGKNVLLFEAKSIANNNEAKQIRKAVGQLLEYRYRDILQDDDFSEMSATLWLLLSKPPSDSFKYILRSYQDKGIYTLWIQDDDVEGPEYSLEKLQHITNKPETG